MQLLVKLRIELFSDRYLDTNTVTKNFCTCVFFCLLGNALWAGGDDFRQLKFSSEFEMPGDSVTHDRANYHRPPVSLLLGIHQAKNTGAEIGISRSVGMNRSGGRSGTDHSWAYTYSVSSEFVFGKNMLVVPKVSMWITAERIKFLCLGANAYYAFDLAGAPGIKGIRPEAGLHFRVTRGDGLLRYYHLKLVYGYNFSTGEDRIGTHQISLVLFRTGNAYKGKNYK